MTASIEATRASPPERSPPMQNVPPDIRLLMSQAIPDTGKRIDMIWALDFHIQRLRDRGDEEQIKAMLLETKQELLKDIAANAKEKSRKRFKIVYNLCVPALISLTVKVLSDHNFFL